MSIERIYLEITSRCNYACSYCMQPIMERTKKHMPPALARRALEQIAKHQVGQDVYFNYLGEPLLHPKLFDLLDYAGQLGLRSHVISNGSLLNAAMIEKVAISPLSSIKISHDSSRAVVAEVHGNLRFPPELILANTRRLVERLQGSGKQIGIVLMATPPQFARGIAGIELISTAAELEAEVATLLEALSGQPGLLSLAQLRQPLSQLNWKWWNPKIWLNPQLFLEIRPVLNWANTGLAHCQVVPTQTGSCGALRDKMGILVNGDVVLCCVDYNGENVLGNVARQELSDILASALAVEVRQGFAENRVVLEKCQRCLGTPIHPSGRSADYNSPGRPRP